jgi:ectoine hydroxylase-related dioxygenase (phytanoyl-CoA dioxygenase family)
MRRHIREHLRELHGDGYTIFQDVHRGDLVDRWLRKAESSRVRAGMYDQDPELFEEAVAHPLLWSFAELVLGPFVQLDTIHLAAAPPVPAADTSVATDWHRDRWWELSSRFAGRPLGLTTMTYLQDLDEAVGPLRVVPGSHLGSGTPRDEQRRQAHPEERLLRPKAGDVVVSHHNLLHSGSPNRSGGRRAFLCVFYSLSFLPASDDRTSPERGQRARQAAANGDWRRLRLLVGEPASELRYAYLGGGL